MADKFLPFGAPSVKTERMGNPPSPAEIAAWEEFAAAHQRVLQTLDMQDGIAAGKAWGRFLRVFEKQSPEYSVEDGSNVIRLGGRP